MKNSVFWRGYVGAVIRKKNFGYIFSKFPSNSVGFIFKSRRNLFCRWFCNKSNNSFWSVPPNPHSPNSFRVCIILVSKIQIRFEYGKNPSRTHSIFNEKLLCLSIEMLYLDSMWFMVLSWTIKNKWLYALYVLIYRCSFFILFVFRIRKQIIYNTVASGVFFYLYSESNSSSCKLLNPPPLHAYSGLKTVGWAGSSVRCNPNMV